MVNEISACKFPMCHNKPSDRPFHCNCPSAYLLSHVLWSLLFLSTIVHVRIYFFFHWTAFMVKAGPVETA
ncbi:hypothetical protein XENTR_v10008560 [Xenopus tropicalis]|nr:hypothetical protein XENTR_v10008560 [Xenopus tropicalis]